VGLVLLVGVAAATLALLAGGRLGGASLPLRSLGLLAGAALVQLVAALVTGPAYAGALAFSALLAAAFVVANVRVPGVALVGLGLLLNAVVVAFNGAMPVPASSAARAGVALDRLTARHDIASAHTRLGWLGDTIPVPAPWRAEVVSPGDVLVAAGVGLLVFTAIYAGRRRAVAGSAPNASRSPGQGDFTRPL
jgi:hypothetical protein